MSDQQSDVWFSDRPSSPSTVGASGIVSPAESKLSSTWMSPNSGVAPQGQRYPASRLEAWLESWRRYFRLEAQRDEQLLTTYRAQCPTFPRMKLAIAKHLAMIMYRRCCLRCGWVQDFLICAYCFDYLYNRNLDPREYLQREGITLPKEQPVSHPEQPQQDVIFRPLWMFHPRHRTVLAKLHDECASISGLQ